MNGIGGTRGSYRVGAALALILALAALLLASCEGVGRNSSPQSGIELTNQDLGPTGPQGLVTLEMLTRSADRYFGEQVVVNGSVERVIEPDVFSLTSSEAAKGDKAFEVETALVAGKDGSLPNLSEGQRVQVTGEVQRFNIKKLEQELNTNLSDKLYVDLEEKPVIVPGTVEVLPGRETTGG